MRQNLTPKWCNKKHKNTVGITVSVRISVNIGPAMIRVSFWVYRHFSIAIASIAALSRCNVAIS